MKNIEEYFNSFYRGAKSPELKTMRYFMKKYNNFDKTMKFIHIAGTNGKGSCTEIISNILIKQGYKVGKFISPHLIKYNERISINKRNISDEEILELINELQPLVEEYKKGEKENVTFFEFITILALIYFYRNKVDFVILETGLGGLYDCTNVITRPLVSVITSIGYDHMNILGKTLKEIAYQKAGIIKENSHTVIFKQEPKLDKVFIDECKKKNNILHIVQKEDISNYSFNENYQYFDYKNIKNICLNLKGKVQIKNACLSIETIKIINSYGYNIDIKNVLSGLKTVIHKGRMETLNNHPKIIFDGAHNEPAINNLLETVNIYYPKKNKVYIVSILARKDYKSMLKNLAKDENAIFILTSGNQADKFISGNELYDCMKEYVNKDKIFKKELKTAINDALKDDDNNKIFLVVGSFYTYGTVMEIIDK